MHPGVNGIIVQIASIASHSIIPTMLVSFGLAVCLRSLIYYTINRELWFVKEFEKRVYTKLDSELTTDGTPFYRFLRRLLEKTYYEVFELRARYRRRNPDYIMSLSDRLFLIQDGSARLINDTLKYLKYYERNNKSPQMIEIAKNVFNGNPAFSRVLGLISASVCNSILDMMPGLFVIGGIFGTFMGIMNALPQLSGMDMTNAELTKKIMDEYLNNMAGSLAASALGIFLSVCMNIFNALMDPEGLFISIVDRYSSTLTVLWNRCNVEPGTQFYEDTDEDLLDESEIAAKEAVNKQLDRNRLKLGREGHSKPNVFNPPFAPPMELINEQEEGEISDQETSDQDPPSKRSA